MEFGSPQAVADLDHGLAQPVVGEGVQFRSGQPPGRPLVRIVVRSEHALDGQQRAAGQIRDRSSSRSAAEPRRPQGLCVAASEGRPARGDHHSCVAGRLRCDRHPGRGACPGRCPSGVRSVSSSSSSPGRWLRSGSLLSQDLTDPRTDGHAVAAPACSCHRSSSSYAGRPSMLTWFLSRRYSTIPAGPRRSMFGVRRSRSSSSDIKGSE